MDPLDLRVDITDADVRYARRLWRVALDDEDVPVADVERLYEDLRRIVHAQAQQIADDFRARRGADNPVASEGCGPIRLRSSDVGEEG